MSRLNDEQIGSVAFAAGFRGERLATAIAVAIAESGGRSDALGDTTITTSTWGPSVGLWQVRSLKAERGTGKTRDHDRLFDPAFNARSAWTISGGGANFRPWSVFTNGAYSKHMARARNAQVAVERTGGSAGGSVPTPRPVGGGPGAGPGPSAVGVVNDYTGEIGGILDPTYREPMGLESMKFMGAPLGQLLGGFGLRASVDISNDQISQVKLTIADPELMVISEPWLDEGVRVDWGSWRLEVAVIDTGEASGVPTTEIGLWPRGVTKLKWAKGQDRNNISAVDWIRAEAEAVGLEVRTAVGPTYARAAIGPQKAEGVGTRPEKVWTTMRRLANEEGYWLWVEPEGILWIGKPTELQRSRLTVNSGWKGSLGRSDLDVTSVPRFHYAPDPENIESFLATLDISIPRWRGERVRPGMASYFHGPRGRLTGKRIITSVSWEIAAELGTVEISATNAHNPPGTNPTTASGVQRAEVSNQPAGSSPTAPSRGTRSALDFLTLCQLQVNKRYIFGAEVKLEDPNPSAFDCSELIQWACHQVGVTYPDGTWAQEAASKKAGLFISQAEAARTPGALLFREGHVAICIGDGVRTVEARNSRVGVIIGRITDMSWTTGAKIPGMNYGNDSVPRPPAFGGAGASGSW